MKIGLRPVTITLIFLILLICITSTTGVHAELAGWNIVTVESGGVGQYCSLAFDSMGNPRISYYDQTHGALKYAQLVNGSWMIETVDTTGNVGLDTSMTLDSKGNAWISYFDLGNGHLKLAHYNGTGWEVQTVDTSSDISGEYSSMALDKAGNPAISYHDSTQGSLKYAHLSNGLWSLETVDSNGDVGVGTSLAFNSASLPQIVYSSQAKGLKIASFNGSGWNIQVVDLTTSEHPSLRYDKSWNPLISYFDITNGTLKIAMHTNNSWSIEKVDKGGVGEFSSLAIDNYDRQYVSYFDMANKDLKVAAWDGQSWIIHVVDSNQTTGIDSSLALNRDGKIGIAYYDLNSGSLKFALGPIETAIPEFESWYIVLPIALVAAVVGVRASLRLRNFIEI